jgi:hypothetical protein
MSQQNETNDVPLSESQDQLQDNNATENIENPSIINPWPFISDFFTIISVDPKNKNLLKYQCLQCTHKKVLISAHSSSFYNLKTHLKRSHFSTLLSFENLTKANSKRGRGNECAPNNSEIQKKKQKPISEMFLAKSDNFEISQDFVDQKTIDFFVENMIALRAIDSKSFKDLFYALNPKKTCMSRRTLGRRILDHHRKVEDFVIRFIFLF